MRYFLYAVCLICLYSCSNQRGKSVDEILERLYWYENLGNSDTANNWQRVMGEVEYAYITYNNDTLKKGKYKHGLKDGLWIYYNTEGDISATKFYDNGIPSGKWSYFFKDSVIYSELRTDTKLQVLIRQSGDSGNEELLLLTIDGDGMEVKKILSDSFSVDLDKDYRSVYTLNGRAFAGYYICDNAPTTTWLGNSEIKDGYLHGEAVTQGFRRIQNIIHDKKQGAYEFSQIRYADFYCLGSYINDLKYGTWSFSSFRGDYDVTIVYDMDSIIHAKVEDAENHQLVVDKYLIDSLIQKISEQF